MWRVILVWIVALPVAHWLVAAYSRSVRRERLEREFDAGGKPGTREAYVAQGMADYEHSLRARLIVLVYIMPVLVVAAIAYLVNRN